MTGYVTRALLLVALSIVAGCGDSGSGPDGGLLCYSSFDCTSNLCLESPTPDSPASFCVNSDSQCASGLRWDVSAGEGLAGQCVVIPAGTSTPPPDLTFEAADLAQPDDFAMSM